jgi:hypothetical protein
VFSFGDAVFFGSTCGKKPNGHDATGLATSLGPAGAVNGYWMVFEDGGVFTFGDAPFLGSSGGNNGGSKVTGITSLPGGHAYAWVHANGQVNLSQTIPSVVIASNSFGTVWTVLNDNVQPAASIQLLAPNGGTNQQWQIFPTNQDAKVVQLVNVNSGLCADLTSDSRGAFLIQFTCKGKNQSWDNQRFKVITDKAGLTDFEPVNATEFRLVGDGPSGGLILEPRKKDPNTAWKLTNVQ